MKTSLTMLIAAFSLALMVGCTANDETDTAVEQGAVDAMDGMSDAAEESSEAAEHAGEEFDDAGVTGAVKTALINSLSVGANSINVDTEDQVVYLRGSVSNEEERATAQSIAEDTAPDGYTVVNELTIGDLDEDDGNDSP